MPMLRSTFLAFALPAIGIATAQLPPEGPATTGQHMQEVNPRSRGSAIRGLNPCKVS